jgi:ferredoxin
MKVIVDFSICDSNGVCVDACPEVFELDEADQLHVLDENPPEELREKVREAVRGCPKAAITLEG